MIFWISFSLALLIVLGSCSSLSLVLRALVSLVFIWTITACGTSNSSLSFALLTLLWFLSLVFFLTSSLLLLYISFEISLLPLVLLLVLFGYQPEKLQASMFLLAYTVIGSLPLLFYVGLSLHFCIHDITYLSPSACFVISLAFFIKSPLYFLHSWLPKAHTEAPLLGSIILAGVILKFGGYGILLLAPALTGASWLFFYVTLVGSCVCSICCLRHWDTKALVAYSRVVHMGVVTLGALLASEVRWGTSLGIIVSHSFISPLLFSACYTLYCTRHSRSLVYNFLGATTSSFTLFSALLICINIGTPPFLRFMVEVVLYLRLCDSFMLGGPILFFVSFFVFFFSIWLYICCFSRSKSHNVVTVFSFVPFLPGIVFSFLFPFCFSACSF